MGPSLADIPPEVAECVLLPERLDVTFDDVGSLKWVKEALDETGDEGYATATANDRFVIPEGALLLRGARSLARI